MSLTLDSGQDLFDLLSPEMTSPEAVQYLSVAEKNHTERTKETETANKATESCQAQCDDDGEILRYLRDAQTTLTRALGELRITSRAELDALRGACNIEDISALIARKSTAVAYVDSEYDHMLTVQAPADHILLLDALANEASAEWSEVSAAAALSRVRTLAALGPVIALEGANVGFIGAATEALREQARILAKKVETARNAARDARIAYDRMQSARISRGILTH
jgi:hypothetical protein